MAIEREPTYQQEPPPSTRWDDIVKLAGKMKSPEANQNPPVNETQQKAIDSVLDIINDVYGKTVDEEEIRRKIAEKTEGLWSRDFAINLWGQYLDKVDPDNPHDNVEADVWELVYIGMPAELIVENEDFYDSMLRNEHASLPPGALSTFHRVMSATDAGKDRFHQDFIENGYFNVLLSSNIEQIYKNGECDDATMNDLKVLSQFGIRVAELAPEHIDSSSWRQEGPALEEALEYGENVRKITNQLIQNQLISGEDYDYVVRRFVKARNVVYDGMMDAMLENGLEPKKDGQEADYWVSLSEQSGENMLKKFVYGDSEVRQSEFDFTKEPIMRAFAEQEARSVGSLHTKYYQTPQFREALSQPLFQDIILQTIDKTYQEINSKYTGTSPLPCPSLFYFLAENRDCLASLGERDAFKACPSLSKYENTEKFINGNYTERDRLSLFLEDEFLKPEFFDEEGELNLEFYENLVSQEKVRGFVRRRREMIKRIDKYFLDPNQKRTYRAFKAIAQNSEAVEYFKKHFKREQKELSIEKIESFAETLNRLLNSNAEEISNHVGDFLVTLLSSEDGNPETIQTKLDRIEDVFIHNNLPYFGKVFKTFRVLYPERKNHRASNELERGAFKGRPEIPLETDSPPSTLRDFETIIKSKDSIIFNDLMKASMGSNNRDLRRYLNGLLQGAELVKRVNNGETELSEVEQRTLAEYAEHLKTIYANTQAGKQEKLSLTDDLIEDIRELSKRFSPTSLYSIPDRVVRSFGFMLGIRGCQDMLDRMDRAIQEADARNRASARAGNFRLDSGDLIKSTEVEYLGQILQNGSVSKEFLNGEQASDSTPLDTDLNVLPVGLSGNISEGVDVKNRIAAFGTMHCMMVMKGDTNSDKSRFVEESDSGAYDPNRYEIWHNGGDNYGIRVGFPSTEIDYFIYDSLGLEKDPYGNLERMKYEIVKNGFYIPIVDKKSGELIFSPEEYDGARSRMSGLTSLDGGEFVPADSPERNFVPTLTLESYTFPDGTTIEGTSETIAKSQENKKEVDHKREVILSTAIDPVLSQFGLTRKDHLDGDLTEGSAEVIDTGSTGRYSNAPGDGDFDFMMKLDRKDSSDLDKLDSIRRAICKELGVGDEAILGGNIRAKNVSLPGLDEPVDVDITFSTKTNKVRYTTDVALKEFYDSMPPEKRQKVVANVVFAKRFLKSIHAYKPDRSDRTQGGLGGVGVENWILQNGGSFLAATRSFMETANECGDDLDAFRGKYAIFDYGQNHQGGGNDNFVVRNLNQVGYDKMREALAEYLAQVDK